MATISEKSIGAVTFRQEGKRLYLLLHYPAGHWDFIKGNVETGEEEKDTLRREAKEEANLDKLEFIPDFRERINYFYRRDGSLVSKQVVFYLVKTPQKEIKISHEHQGFEWLEYKNALERLTFKNAKEVLEKAEKALNNTP